MATEKAIFAAGCFWGVEAAFRQVDVFWRIHDPTQVNRQGCHIPEFK